MLTILFVLCLSLLDFQRPAIPDSIEKQFVVTELQEQTTTGCASSPQAGRPTNHQIFIDQHAAGPQSELPLDCNNPLPLVAGVDEQNNVFPVIPAMLPHDPPGLPDSNPDPPPVAAVPEPPTLAILTISGVVLLYLLFGRKREKLYRRR